MRLLRRGFSPQPSPGGAGWRRALVAFGAAGAYSLAVTYGSVEQLAYIHSLIEVLRGQDCRPPTEHSTDRPAINEQGPPGQ